MGIFSTSDIQKINEVAEKSNRSIKKTVPAKASSMNDELHRISEEVLNYFQDSEAILITNKDELHDYIDSVIECGYAGIDTETTGLDRSNDTLVGASLYYPGGSECYIPMKHVVPIFDTLYSNQLTYEEVGEEFRRLQDSDVKLIFANADFDLAMIYKDLKVDFNDRFYYDVILAWRCLKENERDNTLKGLYTKYVLKGEGDPKKFSDFFTPSLFPYSKPSVAMLYAANDARITYDLFKFQLPYTLKDNAKCQKQNLEAISDLIWNVEFPLVKICQNMHREGMYVDKSVARMLRRRYSKYQEAELSKLAMMVDEELARSSYVPKFGSKPPFTSGEEFNPNSPPHVKHLLYDIMDLPSVGSGSTDKRVLSELNLPITDQILKVRSNNVLINTFVEKLPNAVAADSRIHAQFRQLGASTGRFSSAEPNLQNIPSNADDIRHLFRATPSYDSDIQCTESREGELQFSVSKYAKMYLEDGMKCAEDVVVGDKIKCVNDGDTYYNEVTSIEDDGGGNIVITLKHD